MSEVSLQFLEMVRIAYSHNITRKPAPQCNKCKKKEMEIVQEPRTQTVYECDSCGEKFVAVGRSNGQ